MEIPFWAKALEKRIPVSAENWKNMSILNRWVHFANRDTLTMSVITGAAAGMLAMMAGFFDPAKWVLLLISLIFAHAFSNMFNDFSDPVRGTEKGDYLKEQYYCSPAYLGFITRKQALVYMAATGTIALTAALSLAVKSGVLAFGLIFIGIVFNFLYVYALKTNGLGEISIVLVWGPLMFGWGFYVLSGSWDWQVALFGAAYGISVAVLSMGRHLDRIVRDSEKNIITLPVLLGESAARKLTFGLILLQYLIVIFQVLTGVFSFLMLSILLGTLLTLPMMGKAYLFPKPHKRPDKFPESGWQMWFIAPALYNNTIYSYAFILALALESVIRSNS